MKASELNIDEVLIGKPIMKSDKVLEEILVKDVGYQMLELFFRVLAGTEKIK